MVISLCYIKCKKVDPFGSGRSIDLVCPQITIPSPILYGQFTNISNICILQSYCCIWYHQYSNYTVRNNNVIHITIIYHVIQFYRCILYHIILSLYIYIITISIGVSSIHQSFQVGMSTSPRTARPGRRPTRPARRWRMWTPCSASVGWKSWGGGWENHGKKTIEKYGGERKLNADKWWGWLIYHLSGD